MNGAYPWTFQWRNGLTKLPASWRVSLHLSAPLFLLCFCHFWSVTTYFPTMIGDCRLRAGTGATLSRHIANGNNLTVEISKVLFFMQLNACIHYIVSPNMIMCAIALMGCWRYCTHPFQTYWGTYWQEVYHQITRAWQFWPTYSMLSPSGAFIAGVLWHDEQPQYS